MKAELQIDQLREAPEVFQGELDASILDLSATEGIRNPGDLVYNCRANVAGEEVLVQGSLEISIEFECVKCLDFYSTRLAQNNFVRSFALADVTAVVDLAPEFREEILLTFPGFPQCSADCAGLCPVCGANKNRKRCECELPEADDRWGGLDSLNLDETS